MNRRGFLTNLFTGTVAALAAPQIVTHGLGLKRATDAEVVQYAVVPPEHFAIPNPEYMTAQYEMSWVWDVKSHQVVNGVVRRRDSKPAIEALHLSDTQTLIVNDACPMRFKSEDDYRNGKPVAPFIIHRRQNA